MLKVLLIVRIKKNIIQIHHYFLKTEVQKLFEYFIHSRSIQVDPMKPAVQTHLNFSTSLKHLAPFLQGSSPQGFAKIQKRPQYSGHCFFNY